MKKNISLEETNNVSNLNSLVWPSICKDIEKKLGKDIYESWIKKLNLVEEFQHYLVLSSPTRFIRDWVVSRYIDRILAIVKLYKKTVHKRKAPQKSSIKYLHKSNFVKQNQKS